jgi:hypothetical protein
MCVYLALLQVSLTAVCVYEGHSTEQCSLCCIVTNWRVVQAFTSHSLRHILCVRRLCVLTQLCVFTDMPT